MTINLKREFEKILQKYGHDVLVLRQNKKIFCSCYNEINQEASRDCPLCLGLGHTFVAERHRTRSEDVTPEVQLSKLIKGSKIGEIVVGNKKYYFNTDMTAEEKDLIIEVEWTATGQPIYKNRGIWAVSAFNDNLTLGEGQDVYKIYYVQDTPVKNKLRGLRVSELNGIKQYSIILEGYDV